MSCKAQADSRRAAGRSGCNQDRRPASLRAMEADSCKAVQKVGRVMSQDNAQTTSEKEADADRGPR
eukprot:12133097-Alexandrium_andersonii.AAC.1